MFYRHDTQLNLCKISDFMEYFLSDEPEYRWCDYVVSYWLCSKDTTAVNKRRVLVSS